MTIAADQIVTADKLMTADDLLALGPDFHGELVRGRMIEMAPAGWKHGIVGSKVLRVVANFVESRQLGSVMAAETGFILSDNPATVRAPDVAFVRASRVGAIDNDGGFFPGPPDLAVEVLSPANTPAELLGKIGDFLRAGTRLVWVVDPQRRTVTVHQAASPEILVLTAADTLTAADLLPGFAVNVAQFFE